MAYQKVAYQTVAYQKVRVSRAADARSLNAGPELRRRLWTLVSVALGAMALGPPSAAEELPSPPGALADAGAPTGRAASGAEEAAGEDLEAAGDADWSRASSSYREAFRTWEELAARAVEIEDGAAVERSLEARASLAVLLREPKLLDRLPVRRRASSAPPLLATEAPEPGRERLEELVRFFSIAGSRFPHAPHREERDLITLKEAVALSQRLLGDYHQLRADQAFTQALAALGPAPAGRARATSETRLRYKLRDFAGASAAAAAVETGGGAGELGREERLAHLSVLSSLACFQGDGARVLALEGEIRALGSVAEESARPGPRFPSFLSGSSVDLVATLETLLQALAAFRLGARETALAGYIAGLAAMELGDWALAGEILGGLGRSGSEDPWLAASWSARLGAVRGELGEYEASLDALLYADQAAAGLEGTDMFRARVALSGARALIGLGRLRDAREAALRALGTYGIPADLKVRARILLGAVLYEEARQDPGRLGDARAAFETAGRELERARESGEHVVDLDLLDGTIQVNSANLLREEARLLEARGAAADGRELRKRAIELQDGVLRRADAAGLVSLAAVAASNLGELYLEEGDLKGASSFIEWALRWAEKLQLFETEWRCHWYRARVADLSGDTSAADREYGLALAIVESYRSRVLDFESKSGFLTDKLSLYQDLVRRELRRGDAVAALSAAERAKARTLVESLGWRHLALSGKEDTRAYREFVELLARGESSREREAKDFFGARVRGRSSDEERRKLSAFRERLAAEGSSSPLVRTLIDGDPASAGTILRCLPSGTTLVEYFFLGDRYAAFVARGGAVEAVVLDARPAETAETIKAFLAAGAGDAVGAERLYRWFLAPVEDLLESPRLLIVPYGMLHQVPFETFRGPEGKYALERWEISYLPSGGALRFLSGRSHGPLRAAGLLALVDPDTDYDRDGKPDLPELPGARREVEGFSSLFAKQEVLVGGEALEQTGALRATGHDVVHYACHGEFYPSRPWDSCLFLTAGPSGSAVDDGLLRVGEVFALDLGRSRLVSLSGCETARKDVLPGDDTVSIGTAFLHAGAGALLASLWKVEDAATSALMQAFYRKWIHDGKDKVEALREAKLALLAGAFAHPRQWGSFVLIGEP